MAETPLLHRHLTGPQRQTLVTIDRFHRENGFAPTVREVQDRLALASPSSAFDRLERLRRKGMVEWRDGQFRTLRVTLLGREWLARHAPV